ncbi:YueH family protein [Bacillus sp. P14.5]|uniref:YueH family protein n=1 Tax=Bacillus sp. P14.5 TaxID=1983400 RepID=UPI000DE9C563|nr:YueH family protein [Bacillus sp. P14.5]
MKIRKSFAGGRERKVFIYENKKEEYFMVAIPDIGWSIDFTYESDMLKEKLEHSISSNRITVEESTELASRIYNWTREM